jgi:hypothetical protein
MLIYESIATQKYGSAFVNKVKSIAKDLRIDPNWLMAVMKSESGLSHSITNSMGCVGLIQFCPGGGLTAFGQTVASMQAMGGVAQLDLVHKYFMPYRGRIKSAEDLYLITFYPYALGKPDSYVFGSEQSQAYARSVKSWNPPFDLNGDGVITMAEFKQWARRNAFKDLPSKPFGNDLVEGVDNSYLVAAFVIFCIVAYTFRNEVWGFYKGAYKGVKEKLT